MLMLVSEFKSAGNPPSLPASLPDGSSFSQYLLELVVHARRTAEAIDDQESDGKHRQQRIYTFRIIDFPELEFSIRVPTRHHYRLEGRGLPEITRTIFTNTSVVSNQSVVSN